MRATANEETGKHEARMKISRKREVRTRKSTKEEDCTMRIREERFYKNIGGEKYDTFLQQANGSMLWDPQFYQRISSSRISSTQRKVRKSANRLSLNTF